MNDDITGRPQARLTILPLDGLGAAELQAYIIALQGEIARAQAMIARRQDHLGAAERVFGKPRGPGPGTGDRE